MQHTFPAPRLSIVFHACSRLPVGSPEFNQALLKAIAREIPQASESNVAFPILQTATEVAFDRGATSQEVWSALQVLQTELESSLPGSPENPRPPSR